MSLYLPITWLFRMGSHWLHWKVKSSLWARAVSNGGGVIVRCTWCHTDISLYLPIIWLFRMGSHWLHWKVKSSLWALAVSNGGLNRQIYPKSENLTSFQVFLISSYYLTVSNGLSLTALKSEEFTLSSGSFKWGGLILRFTLNLKIWPHFKFSLYLPIIWLFRMGSHWPHWKVKSSLWALAVSNGGV